MIPTLERIEDPPGVEFREGPYRNGGIGALAIADADLGRLASYLEGRLGLPGSGAIDERLGSAMRAMSARGEIRPEYARNRDHIATYCEHAAVPYENRSYDGDASRWESRWTPLFQSTEPNGFLRTLGLQLYAPDRDDVADGWYGVTLTEDFTNPAQGHPDDIYSRYSYRVRIGYRHFASVAGSAETRLGLDDGTSLDADERASRLFTALIASGTLSPDAEPGAIRDLVVTWCREAGVHCLIDGREREHVLLRVPHAGRDTRILAVAFEPRSHVVRFCEEHRIGDYYDHQNSYTVEIKDDAKLQVVAFLERRQDISRGPGRLDDRLVAGFQALVDSGELNDERPRAGNRERVATLLSGAGIPIEQSGFTRREPLLRVHRQTTDCVYALNLTLNRAEPFGISFDESYDYLPRAGDAGREYAYGVKAPYAQLEKLVTHLEQGSREPVPGDLEERLVTCFRDRVARGELTDGMPLRAARDRVAGWFAEAGVETKPSDWHWFNSD